MERKFKKIAIIGIRSFPSDFVGSSGIDFYVEQLMKELLSNDKNSYVLFSRSNYIKAKSKLFSERIKIISIPTIKSKTLETFLYSLFSSIYSIAKGCDTVWYQSVGAAAFCFLPRLFNKKIVVTVQGIDWQRKKWNLWQKKVFAAIAKLVFIQSPTLVCVSEMDLNYIKEHYSLIPKYGPPGLTDIKLQNNHSLLKKYGLYRKRYVMYLGRIVPEKRIEWLLDKAEYLEDKGYFLVLSGGPSYTKEYFHYLQNKYQSNNIVWTGYIFNKEKYTLLNNTSIFVLPSEIEGNSNSLLEAISLHKTSIAADNCVESRMRFLPNLYTFKSKNKRSFDSALYKAISYTSKLPNSLAKSNFTINEKLRHTYSWQKTSNLYRSVF